MGEQLELNLTRRERKPCPLHKDGIWRWRWGTEEHGDVQLASGLTPETPHYCPTRDWYIAIPICCSTCSAKRRLTE